MKKLRWVSVSAAAMIVVTASAIGFAQQEDSHWIEERAMQRMVSRVEHRLKLSAEQSAQMRSILKAEEPTIVALAENARREHEEMAHVDSFNEASVREVAQRYSTANMEMIVERTKVTMELRAVLNEQQRRQIEEMKTRISGRFSERMDRLIGAM